MIDRKKEVFTPREAGELALASTHMIIRLCNNGVIKCWKIPGSKHRRIDRDELIRFMRKTGIPLGELEKNDE